MQIIHRGNIKHTVKFARTKPFFSIQNHILQHGCEICGTLNIHTNKQKLYKCSFVISVWSLIQKKDDEKFGICIGDKSDYSSCVPPPLRTLTAYLKKPPLLFQYCIRQKLAEKYIRREIAIGRSV